MAMRGEKMQSEVLGVLRQNLIPLTAYDVLEQLRGSYPKLAPPTIYNALSALTKRGQVHRLESLKAYIACQCDRHNHASIMAICDACGKVDERVASNDVLEAMSNHVEQIGFQPDRHIIEIHGVCSSCRSDQEREASDSKRDLLQ